MTAFAVRNSRFTLVALVGLVAVGLTSLTTMPRGEDPPYHAPTYVIVATFPGASPQDMEKLVVKPLEKRLKNLERMKEITTTIREGVAVLRADYQYGVNIDDKYQEITREVGALRPSLPAELRSLEVRKASSSDVKIYQFAVTGPQPTSELRDTAEKLKERLTPLKSLKAVDIWAADTPEVRVDLDLPKLATLGITPDRVAAAIQRNNMVQPSGSVASGPLTIDAKTSGELTSLADLRAVIVYTDGTTTLRLADLATVTEASPPETWRARIDGRRAVWVTASMHDGQNIQAVQDQVVPLVETFRQSLPPGMEVETVFDQPKGVGERLSRFSHDFLLAIGLVLLTLLPLGFRASLVVMVAIPVSLSIGLTVLSLLGYTINQLSIVGMIVALGILVDDSIVVVENTERWLRDGKGLDEAVLGAPRQIALAISGVTALLVFAFLPLLFLPAGSGDFIRSMPMAVVCSVAASLLVALTVVPFLNRVLLRPSHRPGGNPVYRWFDRWLIRGTEPLAVWALRRPRTVLALGLGLALGSLGLFPLIGSSLFPASEKPIFLVNVNLPQGSRLEATDEVATRVEALLVGKPGIASVAANVGHDNPQVYYNTSPQDQAENRAQLLVQLSRTDTAFKQQTIAQLRDEVSGWAGAKVEIKEFEQGPPVEAPVAFQLASENLDTLGSASARVAEALRNLPGTLYVTNPLEVTPLEMNVAVNTEKAGLMGISNQDVGRAVRLALGGWTVGSLRGEGDADDKPIRLTRPHSDRLPDPRAFDAVFVPLPSGGSVPLSQVARLSFDSGVAQIFHVDSKRTATVGAFVAPGYNVGRVTREASGRVAALNLGPEVTWTLTGEAKAGQESFGGLETVILVSLFGFIGVLVLEFRSFRSLLIVLSIIPLGFVGALGMLWAFGESFSFTATVGFIALIGIEIKNSVLLVDFSNELRRGGMNLDEAVRTAGRQRFLPILLTSMTAIGGLIPLVLEYSPLYSPLALVLIGGILSSTLLGRVVTPAVYKLVGPRV